MSDNLKDTMEALGRGFEEFKALHARELAEVKAKGEATAETKAAVERVNATLSDLQEQVQRLETIQARGVPLGEATSREEREIERTRVQNFLAAARGVPVDQVDVSEGDLAAVRAYKPAFLNLLRRGGHNGDTLPAEIKAGLSVGSDPAGGYLVPPDMSGNIATLVYESSPVRQVANIETIRGDRLSGRNDLAEAGSGWVGELASRSETTAPGFGKWEIPVHEQYASPKSTQQLIDDSIVNIEAWFSAKVAAKLARDEATAFVTGDGVARPRGFMTYSSGTPSATSWNVVQRSITGVDGGFHATLPGDVFHTVIGTMKSEYLANARWAMNRTTLAATRKIKDGDGTYLWEKSFAVGQPFSLLGFPVVLMEDMAAIGSSSLSIAFADFRAAYTIVDRAGLNTLRDPYTDKPNVVFYTTRRVGGDLVNFEAIKVIKFYTS